MPIYEYQCEKCGHHLEALQKIADRPLRECPECGKHSLKRLMSAPRFRLAGSGWYETDFKSDKESKRNLVEKGEPEPAKTEAKTETKSETKTEASADTKSEAKPDAKPAAPSASSRSRTTVTQPAAKPAARARPKSAAPKRSPARGKKR